MTFKTVTTSEEETRGLAARLGRKAQPGDVICLSGNLGSGKTTFVQGFAKGAGFRGNTASPTFGLLRQYSAPRLRIYHADFFRVESRELANLGVEEWLQDPKGICLIEWPEAAKRLLPSDRLEVSLKHRKEYARALTFTGLGPRSALWVKAALSSVRRA